MQKSLYTIRWAIKENVRILIKYLFGVPAYIFLKRINHQKRNIYDLFRYKKYPMFRCVIIETSSYCNRRCKTCPVSIAPRNEEYMAEKLFNKIISELKDMKYNGHIFLHLFNETLCDYRIIEKVAMVRNEIPKSNINMNTNGDLLTLEMANKLYIAGLNRLNVAIYDSEIPEHIESIENRIDGNVKKMIHVFLQHNLKGNRAGRLNNVIINKPLKADCYDPSHDIVINYKGDYLLCCEDYFAESKIGNVKDKHICQIWNSKKYKYIRCLLKHHKRTEINICNKCNKLHNIYGKYYLTNDQIEQINSVEGKTYTDWTYFKSHNPLCEYF